MRTLKNILKFTLIIYLIIHLAILYKNHYNKNPGMLEMPQLNYDPTITDRDGFKIPEPNKPDTTKKKFKTIVTEH